MKKSFVLALLMAPIGALFAQGNPAAGDSTVLRLQQLLDAYAKFRGFNGSVLVARGTTILLDKGYGWRDVGKRLPNDGRTQFEIASTTKTFTSAAILHLCVLGKLSLTDKLSQFYPELPYGDSVTIEQMLTHTSGIYDFTSGPAIDRADERKMIAIFRAHPLNFTPGSEWRYSNSNYVLLGYIIGKITGSTYFRMIRQEIFEPLHMESSGFDFTHLASEEKAVGYKYLTDSTGIPDASTDSTVPSAAGAIYSTVEDLYKWHAGLQDGHFLPHSWQQKAYREFMNHYGYGWTVDSIAGRRIVSHSGSIAGFGSDLERVPEDDVCVVVLSNRSGSTFEVQHISRKVLALLYDQPYTIPKNWVIRWLTAGELRVYGGSYAIEEMGLTFRVWEEEGQLYAQTENRPGPRVTMLATGGDHFITREDEDAEVTFVRDPGGRVIAMDIKQRGMVKRAIKIK